MSNIPASNPNQPNKENSLTDRWSYLNQYEKKYLKEAMKAYDKIIESKDDILKIANRYQLNSEDIERAKQYAFGKGVLQNQFIPDLRMAQSWERMVLGEEIDSDEVLLKHGIRESELVINQGMNQLDAHKIAQNEYPWSIIITKGDKQK
ncbi:hypothetical protein [Dolichospermum sp. UHCC 0259]|uniref:hypothetical protein n=1 Tax=Dolichospermum sp. UHCC 0259 TaxID=2590010 RepID=UPI0014483A53|nr:hypothetical protein [Dolichospermum sp. UHCC 0259]MTJ50759.1 hypothetical protein [Dolichospermum sp. UHCC 0259]